MITYHHDDVIKNGRRDITKSRGTSSVNVYHNRVLMYTTTARVRHVHRRSQMDRHTFFLNQTTHFTNDFHLAIKTKKKWCFIKGHIVISTKPWSNHFDEILIRATRYFLDICITGVTVGDMERRPAVKRCHIREDTTVMQEASCIWQNSI